MRGSETWQNTARSWRSSAWMMITGHYKAPPPEFSWLDNQEKKRVTFSKLTHLFKSTAELQTSTVMQLASIQQSCMSHKFSLKAHKAFSYEALFPNGDKKNGWEGDISDLPSLVTLPWRNDVQCVTFSHEHMWRINSSIILFQNILLSALPIKEKKNYKNVEISGGKALCLLENLFLTYSAYSGPPLAFSHKASINPAEKNSTSSLVWRQLNETRHGRAERWRIRLERRGSRVSVFILVFRRHPASRTQSAKGTLPDCCAAAGDFVMSC